MYGTHSTVVGLLASNQATGVRFPMSAPEAVLSPGAAIRGGALAGWGVSPGTLHLDSARNRRR